MLESLERHATKKKCLRPCSHCGLSTYADSDQKHVFCCHGCMGAFALIHELGLEDFYELKRSSQNAVGDFNAARASILDDLEAAGVKVQPMSNGLCSVRLAVDGVQCAACSWLIERMQPTIRGLHSAQVRMSDQTVELIYDPQVTSPGNVSRKLARLGYGLSPWIANELDDSAFHLQQRGHWIGIALAAFFAANAMWIGVALYAGEATGISRAHEWFLRWVGTTLAMMAVVWPGRIFFETAWQAIRTRTPHIDIPIAFSLLIGSLGSLYGAATGVGQIYFDSLASLILLLRIGRYIQFRAQYRASSWVGQLLRLNSVVATRLEADGTKKTVPAHRLAVGDHVFVAPGEAIPADGIVQANDSHASDYVSRIDMSLVNGESTPVSVHDGDVVVGGTTNLTSPLTVLVTAVGEASRVGRLMELVRNATSHRTPWIRAADWVSKWFVMAVLGLAVATWIGWSAISNMHVATEHTMALLTIACPCALALAAPLVLTVALGRAAKKQIWIRDGNCLERMATPGIMWLDKTGTLTHGRMTVHEWLGESQWLAHAAVLERCVIHPIATAIQEYAADHASLLDLIVSDVHQVNGRGVSGTVSGVQVCIGNEAWLKDHGIELPEHWLHKQTAQLWNGRSVVWMSVDDRVVGLFAIGDSLREETIDTLREISNRGWKLGIVSGDRQEIVNEIASEIRKAGVPLEAAWGGRNPEEKFELIRSSKIQVDGPCVMVGDGVNDAAAMALADVGIAIRGGSDQAMHAAPIYLANQRLSSVVELIDSSKKVIGGIRRCFIASLLYNSVTIALAMTGWIHPLIAAILMPISGLTVLVMAITTKSFPKST